MKIIKEPKKVNEQNVVEECDNFMIKGFCCKTIIQDPNKPTK